MVLNCARRYFYQYANHLPNHLLSIELKYPDFFLPLFDLLRSILYYFVQAELFHANLRFQKEENFRCMTFADCRPQTADCRPQTADCRPQTADCRLQTADCRLQTADRRLQTADCRYFCAKLHWPHSQNAVGYSSPTLYHLTRHITNCIDSSFFFDYSELIMTSSNAH